jgi:hypothetical protein
MCAFLQRPVPLTGYIDRSAGLPDALADLMRKAVVSKLSYADVLARKQQPVSASIGGQHKSMQLPSDLHIYKFDDFVEQYFKVCECGIKCTTHIRTGSHVASAP